MSVVLIAGTNSWDNDGGVDWFHPQHAFPRMLKEHGINVLFDGNLPFVWSTDVDGLPIDRKNNVDWAAAGAALSYFLRMKGVEEVDMIVHSHGLQVVLYAIAHYGVKVRKLLSFGSPVRKDLTYLTQIARQNIGEWIHIYSDSSDRWQWLGELFDGHFGIVRKHPLADRNDFVPNVGHSELLRNPDNYRLWIEKGWIQFLVG